MDYTFQSWEALDAFMMQLLLERRVELNNAIKAARRARRAITTTMSDDMTIFEGDTVAGTTMSCPQGCGGVVPAGSSTCPSCRRTIGAMEIPVPSWCWEWFGPAEHRRRCRRERGHSGDHYKNDGPFPSGVRR